MPVPDRSYRFLTLCGSLRAGSLNRAVARTLAELGGAPGSVVNYEGLGGLPFFNPDVELAGPPAEVLELRGLIAAADGVVVVSPEYAHGTSGVLKNGLEWIVGGGEFTDKPTAVVTASPAVTGGDRAQAWLVETLEVMGAHLVPGSMTVPTAGLKITDGRVTDPATLAGLRAVLAALAEAADRTDREQR
ncbi:NADPH-dependent FMN reductase [Kitasatospora sp. NPDC002227]|uniref:NADPH-dependent FMN reductase n=1 Tax=Kitasatospora sp. NPDC002227 TaxID=3154773 RepID=UPI00331F0D92